MLNDTRLSQRELPHYEVEVLKLAVEMADELDMPFQLTARAHLWRSAPDSILPGKLPEVIRSAHFGRDLAAHCTSFTGLTETSRMSSAACGPRAGASVSTSAQACSVQLARWAVRGTREGHAGLRSALISADLKFFTCQLAVIRLCSVGHGFKSRPPYISTT